jgi:hypothetical protein
MLLEIILKYQWCKYLSLSFLSIACNKRLLENVFCSSQICEKLNVDKNSSIFLAIPFGNSKLAL